MGSTSLFLARENSPDKLLTTLSLASTKHLTGGDLEKLVVGNFDQAIKDNQPGAYRGKVILQLRFGQTGQAAATCTDWIKAKPDSWLPRFAQAHIQCRLGETEPAAAQFGEWVNAHKNFAHCIYLALFNYRESRTNQALEAVRLALGQPFVESPGTDGNKFYLGQNGALIAFAAGDYDLCVSLCDKLLANVGADNYWRRQVLRIKAAVMSIKGDPSVAVDLMNQAGKVNKSDAFSDAGMAKADQVLLDAIEKKNITFIRDFRNWIDELDSWFTPFETDESEFHGSDLRVPTPYPEAWKTDRMNPNAPQ
jgi:tetratricopeptide (TPR) repeat protein